MKKILTPDEMKGADEAAICLGLPSLLLMERAALSVMQVIEEEELDTSDVCIVCGTGNNGGDGAALARLFAERGKKADVLFPCGTARVSEQMKVQLRLLEYYGVAAVSEYEKGRYTLVIDALFGIGLCREVRGTAAAVIESINEDDAFVLALDIASGLDGNTGKVCGTAVRADMTVTFAAAKRGHFLNDGRAFTGDLHIMEVGIPLEPVKGPDVARAIEDEDLERLPLRDRTGNKGTFGKLLVVAGSAQICGAAYFAAAAALKSGIGMVRIFTHEKNRSALSVLLPEALITGWTEETYTEELLKEAYDWADACVAGPGLSRDETAAAILSDLFDLGTKPLVLDADACNILAEHPELYQKIRAPFIVTPHMGEMKRLAGMSIGEIRSDPVGTAGAFAGKHGCTVVLKDASTITAYPDGAVYINTSGSSALATAGSGDVLSGLVGSFVLRYGGCGLPVEAMAVHYHGRLGEAAAEELTEDAVTAGSLVEYLGKHI